MKRFVVLFAVLVPLSLFIAGCGDKGASSGGPSGGPSAEQKEEMQNKMKEKMEQGGGMPGMEGGGATPGEAAKK